jgi:PAS domain S-box-containing protein
MTEPLRVAVVARDDASARPMLDALRRAGFDPDACRVDTGGALRATLDPSFDAVLVGPAPPELAAERALTIVAASGLDVPVIVVAPPVAPDDVAALVRLGLADYVSAERIDRLGAAVTAARLARARRAERRRAEEAAELAAAEARRRNDQGFRLLFQASPLPMWVYDVETLYFLEVNDAAVTHYGYSREEFLRLRSIDIRPPEEVERFKSRVAEIHADPRQRFVRSAPWRHRLKDGTIREMDTSGHAIEFGGRRAMLVVAIDITELTRAQEALARSNARLSVLHEIDRALMAAEDPGQVAAAALRSLRDLLRVPRVAVGLVDVDAGTVEWIATVGRRRVHAQTGIRFPLELVGDVAALRRGETQMLETSALAPGPVREALLASGVRSYTMVPMITASELLGVLGFGGETADFTVEQLGIAREAATQIALLLNQARLRERIARQTEDLERRVEARTAELSSANAQLQREIGERRRAEEEADRANRAKNEFLSRMSHELRTPLNGILGFAQLLEMDARDTGEQESVSHILKGGRHLLGLIDEILDIARIEAGRLPISLEPVPVGDAVKSALDLVGPQATARRISLDGGAAFDGRFVLADRQRLQQVLLNLLSNAVKYNHEGGGVTVSCADGAGGWLGIAVADTGSGIAPDKLERLFTPFDRLGAEQGDVEGTGLGLVLSKRLVEAMGGRLLVDSRQGSGSTFTIELPASSEPTGLSSGTDAATTPAARGRGTVLYIEDNVANLRLFERLVERRPGVTLLTSMHGRQGVELAVAHRPDLVVLDLHLPDVAGDVVLAMLRDDPRTRGIPVVILSADAIPADVSRLLAQGARAYLTKPLDVGAVLALFDEVLIARD